MQKPDRRKTTITKVSRRRSTIEHDFIQETRSAPSSPALNHITKRKLAYNKASLDPIENVCFTNIDHFYEYYF